MVSAAEPVYRDGLPDDMPPGIAALPVDRGYPVPAFVADVKGKPDFRVVKPGFIEKCAREARCWICGQPFLLGSVVAFVAGPMCGVNRNSAEPPSHITCADWAARACPFLARPHAKRREGGLPAEGKMAPGAIMRNPGVAMVWITSNPTMRPGPGGHLYFGLGHPVEVRWYREGREATYAEVMESVESGLPNLARACETQQDRQALQRALVAFLHHLPRD